MENKTILIEDRGKLRIIKLNNPRKKNALTQNSYLNIITALSEAADDNNIVIVAITGVGDFYSSGNEFSDNLGEGIDYEKFVEQKLNLLGRFIKAFYEFPKLLIAVVNGPCIGLAATTAALCDIIFCSETAYFQTPFTSLGICAEACSTYTFPRILGRSKAAEMLFLNYKLSADEAHKYNFVSEVFKNNEIDTKIWAKILNYTKLPLESLKITKQLINKFEKHNLEKAMKSEMVALSDRMQSEDFFKAVSKFFIKKPKL